MNSFYSYLSITEPTYSLIRLRQEWTGKTSCDDWVWVGARIITLSESCCQLWGQGEFAELRIENTNLLVGDHIRFKIGLNDIECSQEKFIFRTPLEVTVLTRSALNRPGEPMIEAEKISKSWQEYLERVSGVLKKMGLTRVSTPFLVESPGSEPSLDPFSVSLTRGGQFKKKYLPTSPELSLKKLLASGYTDIFEIKTCFRNDEFTEVHHPEFHMLEWYRAFSNLEMIQQDTQALLNELFRSYDLPEFQPFLRYTIRELFAQHLDLDLTPETKRDELLKCVLVHQIQVTHESDYSWDDLFFLLMIEKIEPQIALEENPVFVCDYPPSQAALARINSEGWADRFELYWKGVELANAFHELNDPKEQLRRFKKDNLEKIRLGKERVPMDQEFINALKAGMPPSGGIALGLDRLFMLIYKVSSIKKLHFFSL